MTRGLKVEAKVKVNLDVMFVKQYRLIKLRSFYYRIRVQVKRKFLLALCWLLSKISNWSVSVVRHGQVRTHRFERSDGARYIPNLLQPEKEIWILNRILCWFWAPYVCQSRQAPRYEMRTRGPTGGFFADAPILWSSRTSTLWYRSHLSVVIEEF